MAELLITLEQPIGIIASILILIGQFTYFQDVWKEKNRTFYSHLVRLGSYLWVHLLSHKLLALAGTGVLTSLTSCTFGCVAIGTASLIKKNYLLVNRDWWFLGMGIFCFVLYVPYQKTLGLLLYMLFSADLIIGIPTIIKAYKGARK